MKLKTQKGITLIALIITIIVMLILVGVTVTVALNGGLFSTAKKATGDTEVERDKELALSDEQIEINGEKYASYQDYLDNNPIVETYSWKQDGNEIKYVSESGKVKTTLMIGDKVDYDEGTDASVTGYEYGTEKIYTINGENDTIATGDLEWRVLGANDEGQLELLSTSSTSCELCFWGDDFGFDGPCNELYGSGLGAESARNLSVNDINKLTGFNPETMYEGYGSEYTYKYWGDPNYDGDVYGILSSNITEENRDTLDGWDACAAFFGLDTVGVSFDDPDPKTAHSTYYTYKISDYLNLSTRDGLSMVDILSNVNGNTILNGISCIATTSGCTIGPYTLNENRYSGCVWNFVGLRGSWCL